MMLMMLKIWEEQHHHSLLCHCSFHLKYVFKIRFGLNSINTDLNICKVRGNFFFI